MEVVSNAVCKAGDDELFLWWRLVVQEGVLDVALEEVVLEAAEVARLLGDGLGGDAVVRGIDCSVDSIQEVMVRGSGEMWKVGATCSGLA